MRFIKIAWLGLLLIACNKPTSDTISVGTIAGPETELVKEAQQVAKQKYGLNVKIIEFDDYNLPNEALNDGALDLNVYQHKQYLRASQKTHNYNLTIIGETFIYPVAIYSKKYRSLQQLPKHAVIAIPNDPSNEARALQLLQRAQLITLKDAQTATTLDSIADIDTNKNEFQFKELAASQLPRVLDEVDAAIINTSFALPAGLNPIRDGLFMEDKHSPYVNIIVMRHGDMRKKQLKLFVKAMHSQAVINKAKSLFGDAAIPAWEPEDL